jgi:hypothetical protein
MAKKFYLTATLPDGYVKTIGPTATAFTHYWRIVADLGDGKTEVFWGHTKSLPEAKKKRSAAVDAARNRGWRSYDFEIVEVTRTSA